MTCGNGSSGSDHESRARAKSYGAHSIQPDSENARGSLRRYLGLNVAVGQVPVQVLRA